MAYRLFNTRNIFNLVIISIDGVINLIKDVILWIVYCQIPKLINQDKI